MPRKKKVEVETVEAVVEEVVETVEEVKEETIPCTSCAWKPGLNDEFTLCPVCSGSGRVAK